MPDVTLTTLNKLKQSGEKIVCLTAYDATFAHVESEAGVEVILIGDSLGMVLQGHDSTLPVSVYGDQLIRTERLQIPHYHMHARAFVLYPLAEIAPALKMPDGTALETLLQNCPRGDLQALPFFIQQPGAQTDLTPPG